MSSATGVASQIPWIPNNAGRTSMVMSINTKDRENARTAEMIPLDNAVNIPLAKILNPIKSRARLQMRFPITASSYTGLSERTNIDTKALVAEKERITDTREIAAITFRLIVISFLSFF